ncbi:hypothetical protein GCM10027443_01260 [Pontibacter brevis]
MQPKVGIVIVSYNASLAVRATLASLRQAKNAVPFKVLLIDNASRTNERQTIRAAFEKHVSEEKLDWKFIQLNKNKGFAGGNNYGIKEFQKDNELTHLCLLNSDVIVSDYWLDRLVEKQIPVISAVTNKADSEQCVPVDYEVELVACLDTQTECVPANSFSTINNFAQNWYQAWKGNVVFTDVTFFCVLIKMSVFNQVGLLDENFFPGGYEDDDYCARLTAMGIDIGLSRDVFMHHFGSASFGQLQQEYFKGKASKNREYLEKKHGFTWKRRPEKPIISYAQDIVFALKGLGERTLQLEYQTTYVESLTKLINHYDNEFTAIKNHLLNCGHAIPEQLLVLINEASQFTDSKADWSNALDSINIGLKKVPCDTLLIAKIEQKLANVSDGIYAKAECNLAMVDFLVKIGVFSSGQPASTKSALKKAKWLFKNGLSFIFNLRGIVFFGGYPYPKWERDGYWQRIRSIDNLFKDRWRVYVDHFKTEGIDTWYDRPEPNVLVLHINNHRYKWFMKLLVNLCVLRCRTVYYHSVLRMEDSKFGSFMNWRGVKKVIDIHGVVPEEFRLHNDFYSACLYDEHEKLAVKEADLFIVVSEAMHQYFQQKYREALYGTKVITLPIFPNISSVSFAKPYIQGKPIVVYAGGTHKWQQVPKMIDAIVATREHCIHKFYCPNPAEVLEMLPAYIKEENLVTVDSKPHHELLKCYEECHYGFILREDIIVNHAACPTKLVEYIAMGIVPIVDCEHMGDFTSLGMQYIRIRDFISGNMPTETLRNSMAEANLQVYSKLQEMNNSGKRYLQESLLSKHAIESREDNTLYHESLKKKLVKKALPYHTLRGKVARKIWLKANFKSYSPECLPSVDNTTATHSAPDVGANVPFIAPCDILVQVDNFLAGGLENVVLDLNETLISSGYKITMLVLGEAGAGVDRAINKGMNVCVTEYSPMTYGLLLKAAKPKLIICHYSIHGAETCFQMNIPLIQVIHNTYMWFSHEQAEEYIKAANSTTAFICVSEFVKDYSISRLGIQAEKCFVIPNGINTSFFKKMDVEHEREALRKKHQFSTSDFVFLSVGSITHQKNHLSAVKSFHQAFKNNPNIKLIILGKVYEQQLWSNIQKYISRNRLESNIMYAGETPNPAAYYYMADAFVHSAFFEGGPLVLLEALAANLPIVSTETGVASQFSGLNGVALVPPPVNISRYKGQIWELESTSEFEKNLALEMQKAFENKVRPNLSSEFVEQLDTRHTYLHYVAFISNLLRHHDSGTGYSLAKLAMDITEPAQPTF